MKNIIKLSLALLSSVVVSCGNQENSNINPQELSDSQSSIEISLYGAVQKGPLIEGSNISVHELDNLLNPTGIIFSTETTNNSGEFSISFNSKNGYAEFSANGYYFDELTGSLSTAPIMIKAISDIQSNNNVRINLLTHLARKRIKRLVTNELKFSAATEQATSEVLTIFGIDQELLDSAGIAEGFSGFDTMDITQEGLNNAILLATSSILLQVATDRAGGEATIPAELSNLLAQIISDIESDGFLDDSQIIDDISSASQALDLVSIRNNIENRYDSIGYTIIAPEFEKFIDSDGDGKLNILDFKINFNTVDTTALNERHVSNSIDVVLPIGLSETATVNNGTIVLNGSDTGNTSTLVLNGDTIAIALTSASTYEGQVTESSATLTIGTNSGTFTINTNYPQPSYPQPSLEKAIDVGIQVERVVLSNDDNKLLISGWRSDGDVNFSGQGFQVFDVSAPLNPLFLGGFDFEDGSTRVLSLSGDGTKAYVGDPSGNFHIMNISDPSNISSLGSIAIGANSINSLALSLDGNTAFVSASDYGVRVLNITNPGSISEIGSFDTTNGCGLNCASANVSISNNGQVLFVSSMYGGIRILDVSNPGSITEIYNIHPDDITSDLSNPFLPTDLVLSPDNNMLYALSNYTVYIFDISELTSPLLVGEYVHNSGNSAYSALYSPKLNFDGGNIYFALGGGFSMVNISNQTEPVLMSNYYETIDWGGPTLPNVNHIFVSSDESYVYAPFGVAGIRIIKTNAP